MGRLQPLDPTVGTNSTTRLGLVPQDKRLPRSGLLPGGPWPLTGQLGIQPRRSSWRAREAPRPQRKDSRKAGWGMVDGGDTLTLCQPDARVALEPAGRPIETPKAPGRKGPRGSEQAGQQGRGAAQEISIRSRWLVRCSENDQTLGGKADVPSPSQGSRASPKTAPRRPPSGKTPSNSLSS